MMTKAIVPDSITTAPFAIRSVVWCELSTLSKAEFLRAWGAIAYLYPCLHPDGYDDPDCGWPRSLKRFAAEAWRRSENGELTDDELYPSDSSWSGILDRLHVWYYDQEIRRSKIASLSGFAADG